MDDLATRLAHVNRLLQQALGLVQQRSYQEAVQILTRVLELEPRHPDALKNLAGLFARLRQPEQAKIYLDRLLLLMPLSSDVHANAASNALALDQVEPAIRLARKAVSLAPDSAPARLTLADALESSGLFDEARSQYLAVLARNPRNVAALSNLLSLRECHAPECHEREAQQLLSGSALSEAQRTQLNFALAHYYDGRQQYDLAFTHISAANATRHRWHPFDSVKFSSVVDELTRDFSRQSLGSIPVPSVRNSNAIFIVGMPRSGTSLVEQILASHSRIAAGGELPTVTSIATDISKAPDGYPRALFALDAGSLNQHAERYLHKLTSIDPHALRVTDKMPFNFLHLGLISALCPDARVIHCRRDPLDTCTSCHFTTFNRNLQFASDLHALGRYYLDYRRLMDHWKAEVPTPMLEVDYEALVTDTGSMIRRMVDFCGVDWEPGCAQFHRTERGIRTPSRWQVRQPMYRHAIGRWRNYKKHLGPLLDTLSPVLATSARQP